eukprot:CAMPEP_0197623904 /NCGR_PEP_ID=MMETSP1338-20131121/3783_1 /TAXON_ID=43686 ORGANISM="Pelagodinium beii, Strain RCC1491" /NCGR_SAMPLE_ID=MMETSP1338 /ASSEMBLY_ACC=CAM_ASM_000754 /LENGTH=215 /DNA_ID=CAMNT_0043193991 /DNA_START=43 /DNA_END=690 /DNA_ORIENTATION=-
MKSSEDSKELNVQVTFEGSEVEAGVQCDDASGRHQGDSGIFLGPPGVLTAAMRWVPVSKNSTSAGTAAALGGRAFGSSLNQFMRAEALSREMASNCSEDGSESTCSEQEPGIGKSVSSTSTSSLEASSSATPTISSALLDRAETCSSPASVSELTCSPPSSPSSPFREVGRQDDEFAEWTLLHTDLSGQGVSPDSPSTKSWGTITHEALSNLGNA